MTSPAAYPAPCAVCRRAGCGIALLSPGSERIDFCSPRCSEIFMVARAAEIELKTNERDAALAGGKQAGGYLDSLGKTDLADMTADEWAEFCAAMVKGYVSDLQKQAAEYVPF